MDSRTFVSRAFIERSGDPLAMLPDEVSQDYLRDQVVIVGHGEVGRRITLSLMEQNIKVVIAEENREIVENLRKRHCCGFWCRN